ncbi:MAG: PAS domain-containing protein, partial [Thermodesulfobacteriota bacterium]
MKDTNLEMLDLGYRDFLPVFDHLSAGVIVVNRTGKIIYYNQAMARIDDIDRREALHRLVTDIYELTPETSMLMQCLRTRRP